VQVSPPNARGEFSLGLGVEYLAPALGATRAIIAEVNDQVPWTHTQPLLRREDFDLLIESSRPPPYLEYAAPSALEQRIANHAAALVPDGATVECGIGGLPNAILGALAGREILYHAGAVCDAVRLVRPK